MHHAFRDGFEKTAGKLRELFERTYKKHTGKKWNPILHLSDYEKKHLKQIVGAKK